MYCGCNKTALASQRQIAVTMLELMKEKPFDQISVCEISKYSGISRQTFYTLFSSREEVINFILREKCECPSDIASPEEMRSNCSKQINNAVTELENGAVSGNLEIRCLCRSYSVYIHNNREFIQTLVDHHLDHLLYDSIYESLNNCSSFIPESDSCTRRYASAFYAGGISSMARCYALEGCTCSEKDLEEKLYILFLGKLFR